MLNQITTKIKVLVVMYKLKHTYGNIEDMTGEQLLDLYDLISAVQHLDELPQAKRTLDLIEDRLYHYHYCDVCGLHYAYDEPCELH